MSEEDYEGNSIERWRETAKNAVGCQNGNELGNRNCRECENLEYCLNYHEETLASVCNWIADLIEESGTIFTGDWDKKIKESSEKALFGEKKEHKEKDIEESFYL